MVHALEGEDTFDMGDATDRRQPLHYRVSPLRASQWCTLSKVKIHLIWMMLLIAVNRYTIVCLQLRASQWCTLSKVKIHFIWVMLLIDINRYSIVCLPLRASQWCTLEGEDTFDKGEATDRHQPIQHRVSPVKSVSMMHPLECEDTFDMGEATDRRQLLHNRVSPLRASQWCTLSKVKIYLIWVMVVLIDVNRYTIVSPITRTTSHSFKTKLKLFIMT